MGKYIIEAKSYSAKYGMVSVQKVFKGEKAKAYTSAMNYAYQKAEKFKDKGPDFTVTIKGEGWLTASHVNP